MRLTQQLGKAVQHVPTAAEIDGPCLQAEYDELERYIANWKHRWGRCGVTVMCDSWTGPTGTTILNFMVSCDGRMFFHKSVDATGRMQSVPYLYESVRKVVVEEVGQGFVVQIVTENGSSFKEACSQLIKELVRWIGELIQPNAARFGTDFVFLQSFVDIQDKLRQWMVSDEWTDGSWSREADYDYTYDCLISRSWWEDVEWVLDIIRPLYSVLQYADSRKIGMHSGFMPRMMAAREELLSLFKEGSEDLKNVIDVVDKRVADLYNDTLMIAAGMLDPDAHYKYDLASNPHYMQAFTMAIQKVADSPANAAEALEQFEMFRSSSGRFDKELARHGAGKAGPANWWLLYGGEVRILQGYAMRIVSQCMSSSGRERNWSPFALMHAQAKNQLAYEKLHKLVYVRYNLRLRTEESEIDTEEKDGKGNKEFDPCRMMMDVELYDKENPIMDWLNIPRTGSASLTLLDEEDECDPPAPSRAVVDMICKAISSEDVLDKPIRAWESKKSGMLDGRKQKRKKGKTATNVEGSSHAMSTRNKKKDLSSPR
ncbi:hypothetical protein ACQ4PT_031918 [Festuca glaucescens]